MSARADRQARRCPARILALPDDILVLIFQCLKFRRVYALSATCKQLLLIEAEHQEDLWHRLASARYPARSLGRIDGSRVWAKAKWTRATWKQRFLYLRARRSTTRAAMADWLNGAFKFRVELISADGLRATSIEDEMLFPNKRHNLAAMQNLFCEVCAWQMLFCMLYVCTFVLQMLCLHRSRCEFFCRNRLRTQGDWIRMRIFPHSMSEESLRPNTNSARLPDGQLTFCTFQKHRRHL